MALSPAPNPSGYPSRVRPAPPLTRVGRRVIIGMAALGAAGLLLGRNLNPLNWLAGLGASVGASTELGFRIYTVNGIPAFDPVNWRLAVDGLVAAPMQLTFDDLQKLPVTSQQGLFHCVTGWVVPNLTWTGVLLTDLMKQVQPMPTATHITLYSSDGQYTDSISVAQASKPDVMLAWNMNGAPLPAEQGKPIRLIIPEMYGYKNIKWVNRIEFTTQSVAGYWEVRGYPIDAYIKQ